MIGQRREQCRRQRCRREPFSAGRPLLVSVLAGSAGIIVMDASSYVDMLIRGRPASQVPSALASRITDALGVGLGQQADNRASALGGLLGNLTGLSIAVGYGIVRHFRAPRRTLSAGLAVGAAAMVASDVPIVAAGVSRLDQWGVTGWVADIVPHAVYGITTVAVYEALTVSMR